MRTYFTDRSKESRLPKCAGGFVSSDLKAFLDKELSPFRTWYVGRHVARCHACNEEVIWLQRLGKNMRLLEDAHPRPELRARILSTLPQMEASALQPVTNFPSRRAGAVRYAFAGALCLLILTVAFAAVRGRNDAHNAVPTIASSPKPASPAVNGDSGHRTPVQPKDNQEISPSIAVAPQDPTSRRADELYAQELKRQKAQAARRLPDDWQRAIASVRTTAAKGNHGPYVQVAMEVQSVAAAQKRLVDWANSAGASARVLPADASVHGNVSIVLTVPPTSGAALLNQLKRVGEISEVASSGITNQPQQQGNLEVQSKADPTSLPDTAKADPHRTAVDGPKSTANATPKPNTTKPATIKASPTGGIVVVVVLSQGQ